MRKNVNSIRLKPIRNEHTVSRGRLHTYKYTHAYTHTLTLSRHCMASILGGRPDGVKRQNTRQVASPAHLIHKSGPENNSARMVGGDRWSKTVNGKRLGLVVLEVVTHWGEHSHTHTSEREKRVALSLAHK